MPDDRPGPSPQSPERPQSPASPETSGSSGSSGSPTSPTSPQALAQHQDPLAGAALRLPESHGDVRLHGTRPPPRMVGIGLVLTVVVLLAMLVLLLRLVAPGTDGTGTLPDDVSVEQVAPALPPPQQPPP
jgi:hypothetical protein